MDDGTIASMWGGGVNYCVSDPVSSAQHNAVCEAFPLHGVDKVSVQVAPHPFIQSLTEADEMDVEEEGYNEGMSEAPEKGGEEEEEDETRSKRAPILVEDETVRYWSDYLKVGEATLQIL